MKIYTKTGDKGHTSLVGGQRVSKDDPRVEAYGTADELCAWVGHLYDNIVPLNARWSSDIPKQLRGIMENLMVISSLLAADKENRAKLTQINSETIADVERSIDEMSAEIPPARYFSLPCGHPVVSLCHICRTVCRRTEREAVRAGRSNDVDPTALEYLNRLSDYLYILARTLSHRLNADEIYWMPNE